MSITLSANSDFTTAGKQFIGLVTGPHRKYGTELEFVGTTSGKRRDRTEATVIEPGLYKVRSTTRKGTTDAYVLVWDLMGRLIRTAIDEGQAYRLAKDLSATTIAALGRIVEAADLELSLAESAAKDQTESLTLTPGNAYELDLPLVVTRADVVAARRRMLDAIRGVVTPELPIEIDALPSAPLVRRARLLADRQAAADRLAQIDADLRAMDVTP